MSTDSTYEYTTAEIKIRRASKISRGLKMTSVILLLIFSFALMILMSNIIKHMKAMGEAWAMDPDWKDTFKFACVSLSIFVIAIVLLIAIIILMVKKKNFNLYKLSMLVTVLILAGFFISFYKLTDFDRLLAQAWGRGTAQAAVSSHVYHYPPRFESDFSTTITSIYTTMCVSTFTYLPFIGAIIFIDTKFR